jgi:hypothetical protein
MGVTIEQHLHNSQRIWVHVSTKGVTRIGRTFPGQMSPNPAAAIVRLSPQQFRKLTGVPMPAISEVDSWQQIFCDLNQLDSEIISKCVSPPLPIPRTTMRKLFEKCRANTSLDEQVHWADQLTAGELASAFIKSIDEFKGYRNTEPFYPSTRRILPVLSTNQPIRSSRDLAIVLNAQGPAKVVNDPCLNIRYVDYEVVPARTTGGAKYDDGKEGRTWVRLDLLLLADNPVIAEVKLRSDKNPFYALVQALTCAAELATPAQRDRLQRRRYPQLLTKAPFEIYTIVYEPNRNGEDWRRLLLRAEEMCRELISMPIIRKYIDRFAILELLEPNNGIVSFKRVFKT